MKGIFLIKNGPAEAAFELRDIQLPDPGPNEVLVKVSHFGLNYADVMSRLGIYNDAPPLPFIPGYEAVGQVVSVGDNVVHVQPGDHVLAFTKFGAYADHVLTVSMGVVRIAPGSDAAEVTALATQYSTAWFAAKKMLHLQKGDRVLIHAAAGGVGIALIQIAKAAGCEIFGTASLPHKLEYLSSIGVDHPINYRKHDFQKEVERILDGRRLDVVFDPVGGTSFKKSLDLLGSGGRIVTYGVSEWSQSKGNFLDKLKLVFRFGFLHPIGLLMKSKAVIGVNMLRIAENRPEYLASCMLEVYDAYQKGELKPHVDKVYDDSEIAAAHTRLESRDSIGKVVVKW